MSDTKHTPTPWTRDRFLTAIWAGADPDHWIASTNVESGGSIEERAANAEFIVKAVNAYQPMLDALKAADAALEFARVYCKVTGPEAMRAMSLVGIAIVLAEKADAQ